MNGHHRAGHRNERENAADGQIDSARDNDKRHATSKNSVHRQLAKRVAMRAAIEEGAIGIENDADKQHQQQGEQCPSQRAEDRPPHQFAMASIYK